MLKKDLKTTGIFLSLAKNSFLSFIVLNWPYSAHFSPSFRKSQEKISEIGTRMSHLYYIKINLKFEALVLLIVLVIIFHMHFFFFVKMCSASKSISKMYENLAKTCLYKKFNSLENVQDVLFKIWNNFSKAICHVIWRLLNHICSFPWLSVRQGASGRCGVVHQEEVLFVLLAIKKNNR